MPRVREQGQGAGGASEIGLVRRFAPQRRQKVLWIPTASRFGQVGVQAGSPQDRSLQGHEAAACMLCTSKSLFLQRDEGLGDMKSCPRWLLIFTVSLTLGGRRSLKRVWWEVIEKAIRLLLPHGGAANATENMMTATRSVRNSCVNICRTDRRCLN